MRLDHPAICLLPVIILYLLGAIKFAYFLGHDWHWWRKRYILDLVVAALFWLLLLPVVRASSKNIRKQERKL